MKGLHEQKHREIKQTGGNARQGLLYLLVLIGTTAIFFVDLRTPLGVAVWVFYFVPIALACYLPRPWLPPAVAVLAALLTVAGYLYSPAGIDPEIAWLNVVLVGSALGLAGVMGVLFVRMRLAAQLATQDALRAQALQQAVVDSLEANIAVVDTRGFIVSVNSAWREFAQANAADDVHDSDYVGQNYLEACTHAQDEDEAVARQALHGIQAVLSGQQPHFTLEYPCHSLSIPRWFLMSVTPLRHGESGVVIAHLDVTARKLAEVALRQSTEQLAMALKAAQMATWHYDSSDDRIRTSAVEGPDLGIVPEALQQHYADFLSTVHPDDRAALDSRFKTALADERLFSTEFRVIRPDGSEYWLAQRGQVYAATDTVPKHVIGVTWDISAIKQVEQELRDARDSLQRMAVSYNRATEDEHLRIARGLHDEVGGHLSALMMQITALKKNLEPDAGVAEQVDDIIAASRAIIESLRRILNELCPPMLADLGLDAALQSLTERLAKQAPIVFRVESQANTEHLDFGTATAIYHVVQSALTNLVQCTDASEIVVTQVRCDDKLCVLISGNGTVVCSEPTNAAVNASIKTMNERAQLLGGSLDIDSPKGKGMQIKLCVPMVEPPEQQSLWPGLE